MQCLSSFLIHAEWKIYCFKLVLNHFSFSCIPHHKAKFIIWWICYHCSGWLLENSFYCTKTISGTLFYLITVVFNRKSCDFYSFVPATMLQFHLCSPLPFPLLVLVKRSHPLSSAEFHFAAVCGRMKIVANGFDFWFFLSNCINVCVLNLLHFS